MDKDVPCTGFLNIKTADLNNDGQNEIIISLLYGTSTDMRLSGDFVVYEKHGDAYEKAALPFQESEEGYQQNVPIRYEENFVGEYYFLAVDKEGTILSKRNITQDFDGMGGRLNFSGPFDIVDRDYNRDLHPDFTIGTYGSSTMNLYALYTVSKDGEIELLGRDIPNCSPGAFSAAFEQGNDKTFYASIWDNVVGEEERIVYEWNEAEKKYRKKDIRI